MRVLYDISVLGASFRAEYRGGIPRVAAGLLHGLQAYQSECSVTLCAAHSTKDAWAWLQTQPELRHLSLPYSPSEKVEQAVARRRELAIVAHLTQKEQGKPAPMLRVRAAALNLVQNTLLLPLIEARWSRHGIAKSTIYHSPWAAIPQELRRRKRLRFVQTVYDLYPIFHPEECTISQKRFVGDILSASKPTDWFITDSESAKNDLCEVKKVDPARVTVTPLAADAATFYPCTDEAAMQSVRNQIGLPPDAPYILSVCTLEPRKNLKTVILGFVSLLRQQPGLDLYLVLAGGKGWDNDKIFASIEAAGELKHRIIITGFVQDEDLSPLYSGALCFVFPSLYEGFGLPPLEAMQCGTPVITSNTSSLPEVVGDAGIMIDPFDIDGLCQAVWEMHQSSEYRANWSLRGLERAQKFRWGRCAEQTIEAYRQVSSGPVI